MIARKIAKLLKKAKKAHKIIDDLVCDLYDIELRYPAPPKKVAKKSCKKRSKK